MSGPNERQDERLNELLAGRALDDLAPEERAELDAIAGASDPGSTALELVAAALELAHTPHSEESLPESLRDAIQDAGVQAVAGSDQIWRGWQSESAAGGLFTLREDESSWQETGVDGVQVRRLFVDRENNRMTALFRMAPGASYPSHVHDGPEECYVLEGDLHVAGRVLHAGDYQRASEGSEHGDQSTEGGCLLLISSSLSDEMVA